ncbi:hypothetical protein QTP88_009678 [Uroleucon formosanum]
MTPPITTNPAKTKPGNSTKTSNRKQNISISSRIQSASSDVFNSSAEMEEPDFTQPKTTKRILSSGTSTDPKKCKPLFVTTNRYSSLTIDDDATGGTSLNTQINSEINSQTLEVNNEIKIKLPPPIFIQNFLFKSSTNALKVQTINPDSYRKTIHFLREEKAQYHTFQPQEDKAFRVVIRNLHPSTPTTEVGIAIEDLGYSVRQVANVLQKVTKNKLLMFFVDLEPDTINKDIFNLTSLLHTKIKVEEPHKRKDIMQCHNCQDYGHSKKYCAHPPRCVRCGKNHPSSACTKSNESPASCALCNEDYPANYKGCRTYKELQNHRNFSTKQNNVGGDLNAKNPAWGCHTQNPKGQALHHLNIKNFKVLSPTNPTYWPTSPRKRPDILDIFVVNIPNNISHSIKNLLDPCSDHSPVLLIIDAQPLPQPRQACLTDGIMNWEEFRDNLDQNIDLKTRLKTPEDIEIATQNLTNLIQSAAWNSSIKKPPKKHSNPLSIPAFTRELIAQKRRARALWQRSRLPSDKNIYNNLSSSLKRNLNQLKNESFNSWISSISAKDGSLWNATRQCLKQKPKYSPLKKTDGTWCKSDEEKADVFRAHLEQVFQPHQDISDQLFTEHILKSLDTPLPLYLPPKPFTPSEVHHYIKLFPLKKGHGLDLITAEVARQLSKKTLIHLTHILNSILRLSYIPVQWKTSVIILIPKPNKPPDIPTSYRPISLLPLFAKLTEKLILKRISRLINIYQIIPNSQFGFRNKHSTI